jgi:hypothetical protein
LQTCIDKVEAADPSEADEVKRNLPCASCGESGRCLNAKRKELGPIIYDREILTKPRGSESTQFPDELLDPCMRPDQSLAPTYRKPFTFESEFKVVQAWDIAWSERAGGDWLVCMTGVVNVHSGRRMLIDIERWQQKTFPQQIKLMKDKWKQFDADLVVIESDAAQRVWKQQLDRTAMPVVSHYATEKRDFAVGVPSLVILLEGRKWEFPSRPNSYHSAEFEIFKAELAAFGWSDGKLEGVGEHDDTVMTWWHLNWGMSRFVQGTGNGDEYHRGVQSGVH